MSVFRQCTADDIPGPKIDLTLFMGTEERPLTHVGVVMADGKNKVVLELDDEHREAMTVVLGPLMELILTFWAEQN